MHPASVLSRALSLLSKSVDANCVLSPPCTSLTDVELNDQLRRKLIERLCSADLDVVQECGRSLNRGLRCVKKGSLSEAEKTFESARQRIEIAGITEETRLICLSFLSGAAAYLDYKSNRGELAKEKVINGLLCDDKLERDFGYSMLHLHRMHLIENLIRIERRLGSLDNAIKMAGDFLSYLSGASNQLDFPGSWGWQHLSLPIGNIRNKSAALTGDIAQCLACLEPTRVAQLFSLSSQFITGSFVQEYMDEDAVTWFQAKNNAVCGDFDQFLIYADALLSKHPKTLRCAKLWCAIALDVASLCESADSEMDPGLFHLAELFSEQRFWTPAIREYLSERKVFPVS
jgi:hypothetical protein